MTSIEVENSLYCLNKLLFLLINMQKQEIIEAVEAVFTDGIGEWIFKLHGYNTCDRETHGDWIQPVGIGRDDRMDLEVLSALKWVQ